MAPKDLEKYGAPTAHASYFLKKIKVYLLQLLLLKRIKKYFSTCLLFHFLSCSYYYYNTIKQSTLLFSSIMFYLLKRCKEKLFKNILSLLAGKSEQICTAFPLTTFSRQKYSKLAFKTLIQFLVQKFLTSQKCLNKV